MLKVELRETKKKGKGLFATKTIYPGETIAYYKIKIFRKKDYESPTDYMYAFSVYRKNGEEYKRLIGDVFDESYSAPEGGISFWAPFANEPSGNQKSNSEIDIDLENNYKDRNYSVPGDIMIYKLIATKTIKKGKEILWYYGKDYERNYKVSLKE